jgi:membrane protein implicated in regulation of membrane protease activity
MWPELLEFLNSLSCWDWFVLALLFLILEVFFSAAFFLWFGISAGVVGVIVLMSPHLSWKIQLVFFSIGAVISVLMWWLYCCSKAKSKVSRGQNYIGHTYSLTEAIRSGRGKLLIDDIHWVVEGPDAQEGTPVKVVGLKDSVLRVEIPR